jgi:hypothetical protein
MSNDPKFICRLSQLEPEWVYWGQELEPKHVLTSARGGTIDRARANGILFVCPICLRANGWSRVGVHSIECWELGVPLDIGLPGPGRWQLVGTSFEDLTLVAGSSSIATDCAHFYIRNGDILDC